MFRLPYCFGVIIGLLLLGMRGTGKIPVYILYFKLYDIIILLNSVFHTLPLRSAPVGGSASQIAALHNR